MCSLFLQPKSALLFNTLRREGPALVRLRDAQAASPRSRSCCRSPHRSGERASLAGWHQAFDPVNRFGLVMINTPRRPDRFHITGGTGGPADVPQSVPAAVLMIHSFSAADPTDPATIAGRWLANGAFVYLRLDERALPRRRSGPPSWSRR